MSELTNTGSKIERLVKYLIDAEYKGRKLALATQFDAWIEGGRIVPSGKRINSNGLIGGRFYYSAAISINPCSAPVELICAFVSFWLQEHGDTEDSSEVEFSSDKNDDNSSDIELTIETFVEDIELIEKANGPFVLNNKCYDFGKQSLWIAETFTLTEQVIADEFKPDEVVVEDE